MSPSKIRLRPPLFLALGRASAPAIVEIAGGELHRVEVLKHDSWAATALYAAGGRLVVCKFNRQQPIFGLPMRWLGHWLAARERRILDRLAGVSGIPTQLGRVSIQAVPLRHAVAHEFIPGHALGQGEWVSDHFFPKLQSVLEEVHRHDVAHVDLNKRENILVGDDGTPYLIDFQISFALPGWRWARVGPLQWLLRLLQSSDDYHLLKHYARHRPDQCGTSDAEMARRRPWWIRLHRCVAVPFRTLRRRLLVLLGVRSGQGHATTEMFPEVAFRAEDHLRQCQSGGTQEDTSGCPMRGPQ